RDSSPITTIPRDAWRRAPRPSLDQRHAGGHTAVDIDRLARDEASFVTRQEPDRGRDVLRASVAPDRGAADVPVLVPIQIAVALDHDDAGRDTVHCDPVLAEADS